MMLWLLQHIPSFIIYGLIFIGVILYFITNFIPTNLIADNTSTKLVAIIFVLSGVFLQGLNWGAETLSGELEKAKIEIERINSGSKDITEKIVTQYVVKQKVIKEKGDEIIKYVNTNNDADCSLHNSFVELHDSAAENILPDPTRAADETPSGIELSEAKKIIIENYNKYNQVSEQLKDLQEWVRLQKELNK